MPQQYCQVYKKISYLIQLYSILVLVYSSELICNWSHLWQQKTLVTSIINMKRGTGTTIFADRNYDLSELYYYRVSCVIKPFL